MLNLAGHHYDFGSVVFAVLDDLEHRRRSFEPNAAPAALREAAVAKLAQIRAAYDERGGTPLYWRALEHEVLHNAVPQYVPAAVEKTRLESTGYDLWRGGDLLARAVFALGALAVGGLVIAAPFIPIVERGFAFGLALVAWLYPELRRATAAWRHSRLLNRLIAEAESYQKKQLRYMTDEALEEELETSLPREGTRAPTRRAAPPTVAARQQKTT